MPLSPTTDFTKARNTGAGLRGCLSVAEKLQKVPFCEIKYTVCRQISKLLVIENLFYFLWFITRVHGRCSTYFCEVSKILLDALAPAYH